MPEWCRREWQYADTADKLVMVGSPGLMWHEGDGCNI